jgi:phenylpropionate dioxygenase-like ring-hydroxylating dioxygenase large terminal subunit
MAVALNDLVQRLQANVSAGLPDMADAPMKVPAAGYADPAQYKLELERIFLKVPLLVALSCDVREPGDFLAYDLASRPIIVVRGDDGQVRTFLNVCRHRGARLTEEHCGSARRFTCPYHAWSYDSSGSLVGVPGKDSFGEIGATGLLELPTEERVGAVFSCLDPSATLDLDTWLAGFDEALATLRLDELHPYRVPTTIASPNWKLAADGYLDGYHIGYLHRNTIGRKAVTNRNTYDLFGPHVRIGFATKETMSADEEVLAQGNPPDYFSLVHYVFPNVSISGGHGDTLMLSKLLPGATVDRSTTVQFQYYRQPVVGDRVAVAEEKRQTYEAVVRDEDCATIFGINDGLAAVGDGHFVFGRNEPANQQLHRTIARLTHDT